MLTTLLVKGSRGRSHAEAGRVRAHSEHGATRWLEVLGPPGVLWHHLSPLVLVSTIPSGHLHADTTGVPGLSTTRQAQAAQTLSADSLQAALI